MSENAKALSGIYGFVPLSDEPKPKKKAGIEFRGLS